MISVYFNVARQCFMTSSRSAPPEPDGLDEQDIQQLQDLLDQVPEPLQPLDVSAVDGFLCGLLLQPNSIPSARWLPGITDLEAGALPAGFDASPLHALVLRRHQQLQRAISARQWFDPWIFELDEEASVSECVLPWVAGFAAAMDRFPGLMQIDDPQLLEPLSLIYLHFDAQDLEDADAMQQVIDTLEPPKDLGEAVQDLVRSVMLLADISRPVARVPAARRPPRRR
jgi:uncharacterized protein